MPKSPFHEKSPASITLQGFHLIGAAGFEPTTPTTPRSGSFSKSFVGEGGCAIASKNPPKLPPIELSRRETSDRFHLESVCLEYRTYCYIFRKKPVLNWDAEIYNVPAYLVADAARYVRMPLGTLRSWINGRSYSTQKGQQQFEPLIQRPDPNQPKLSFANLVEAHVLRVIRETHQIKIDRVRKALDYLSQVFETEHL
ncbi:MAG: hypothetical protein J0L70_30240 [Leptolyngbya sp. UWPOB_LEPTO1]|uniref:hypothetical protein n=1 Tax=Leptolyngbya sp. UWPOB_LEPTO1 TaxID=2815653 RepID=UPI001AC11ACF|nr:hypothetical protein [Leptolyngbya sp. UWPOB_LEPTO1]MBN8564815.1 hypothetical protein [Leptolyngbya sp. UWPOB_LEPTO1]